MQPPTTPTAAPLSEDALNSALATLLDVGTTLATELKDDTTFHVIDRARAFDLVARAVRQTVLLARHLAEPRPAAAPSPSPDDTRAARRRQVIRAVEDAIERKARPEAAEPLRRELAERMERPDIDHDILAYDPAYVIAQLSRDLGLVLDLDGKAHRRTLADITRLCAQAAAPTVPDRPGPPTDAPRDKPAIALRAAPRLPELERT